MRDGTGRQRRMAALAAAALLGLAACAGPVTTAKPAPESPLQLEVRGLLARQAEGRLGSVRGIGFIKASIVVLLADGEVALLPSTPQLEFALASFHRRWQEGRRQPLPFQVAQEAFSLLTAQRAVVGRLGGESLLRFAKTNQRGEFSIEQVPAGRWLLVTDFSTPVSALLWAVPVEVKAGQTTPVSLGDANILLEARKEKVEEGSKP